MGNSPTTRNEPRTVVSLVVEDGRPFTVDKFKQATEQAGVEMVTNMVAAALVTALSIAYLPRTDRGDCTGCPLVHEAPAHVAGRLYDFDGRVYHSGGADWNLAVKRTRQVFKQVIWDRLRSPNARRMKRLPELLVFRRYTNAEVNSWGPPEASDGARIMEQLRVQLGALDSCYRRAEKLDRCIWGSLTVEFSVGVDGCPLQLTITKDTTGSRELDQCVLETVAATWMGSVRADGERVHVELLFWPDCKCYPFGFEPDDMTVGDRPRFAGCRT